MYHSGYIYAVIFESRKFHKFCGKLSLHEILINPSGLPKNP